MVSSSSETKSLRTFETLWTTRPTTQPHIPEDLHCQQHRCQNLKFRKWREVNLKHAMATSLHFSPSSLFPTVRSLDTLLYGLREKYSINEVLNCWYYIYIYIYIYIHIFMDELNLITNGLLTALWTTTTTTTTTNNNNNELYWTETNQIWISRLCVTYIPLPCFFEICWVLSGKKYSEGQSRSFPIYLRFL